MNITACGNTLEEKLANREALALNLANQLSEKIDDCEALKEEVARLNALIEESKA